jgi:hypothetical protein
VAADADLLLRTPGLDLDHRCVALAVGASARAKLDDADALEYLVETFYRDCSASPSSGVSWAWDFLRSEGTHPAARLDDDDSFWGGVPALTTWPTDPYLAALAVHCVRSAADACLLVQDERIVFEYYSFLYPGVMDAHSCAKSITSLLVGLLLDEGKLPSIDEPAHDYLAEREWSEGAKARVKIRHLLTHTSGIIDPPDSPDFWIGLYRDADASAKSTRLAAPLGTLAYSNLAVQLLSPILDTVAGEPIQEYARRRLFDRIGMGSTRLFADRHRHAMTCCGLVTSPRDMARLGVLILGNGSWRGERVISEGWLSSSLAPVSRSDSIWIEGSAWTSGYLWWSALGGKVIAALGHLDNSMIIVPTRNMLIVRAQLQDRGGAWRSYLAGLLALTEHEMPRP